MNELIKIHTRQLTVVDPAVAKPVAPQDWQEEGGEAKVPGGQVPDIYIYILSHFFVKNI